ncbi:putative cytochrome P450 [Helianthus annuus]|uniref:Cytochrome P450 n=1 Tax=Helianthus annuus TaxID=4232 RepID=A0A251RPV1_HELAN|nr:geraniol 8-hydroxylase [Helianthus annuus]KAF5755356.1 putative cytochrome P450 [Helianthus annuus]KAJ0813087.1 putative cytochrome P450 [Helianthus annuus]KAJ0826212.1 putative cytochrome P450 [Helianthus annuus]
MIPDRQWSSWPEVAINRPDLAIALLTILAITLAIFWYQSGKPTSPMPPGPRGLPVVGYLPFLGPDLLHEFTKMAQRYGPIFKLKLGTKTYIVISSPDLAKAVVREQDEIFANRDPPVAAKIVSYGRRNIGWSDNNSHLRNLRKLFIHEIMSNKNLEASSTFRRTEVRKTVKQLYEKVGTEVDVGGMAFLTSLRVVTNVLWGNSLVEDEKGRNVGIEFREVVTEAVGLLGAANMSDFFPVLSRMDLQGVEQRMTVAWKKIDEILERKIEEKIASKTEDQHGRKDFLEILLELKEQNATTSLDITQIKGLLLDIVTGGTDTTSTLVEWIMAELLQNPKDMKIVQDELQEVVGLNNIVEEYHLPKLQYLDAVIKETLRLHPALPLLMPRSPNESCKVGGYIVPKGANVFINILSIHRDPRYWDNPLEFNPKRFMSLDGTTKFDYKGYNWNFMPFGSGRRMCPGVPMGERMLVYLLASMLHSFDWSLPFSKEHDLSGKFSLLLKKREPLIAIPLQRLPYKTLYM